MKHFTSLFGRRRVKLAGRARLTVERLEGRDLPSVSAPVPGPSGDPILSIAQAEYNQDNGTLTRNDVIHLFDTVAGTKEAVFNSDGTVSFEKVRNPDLSAPLPALWVGDLEAIVQNSGQWGMAPDVANLAGKVVGYNQANEHYQGATLLASGVLAAGDPAGDLKNLVDKWFYGADLPAIAVGGATYQKASGSLFGPDGPQASDIAQGAVGDCYFLSSLAETALQSPQTIESMFIDDGGGRYTVRFYQHDSTTKTWNPDYITVNSELPANSSGAFVYANHDFGGHSTNIADSGNVLWVALAEKAYAQLAEEGWSRGSHDANAYDPLAIGDNLLASQQITGFANGKGVAIQNGDSIKTLAADFQNGDLLTICTLDQKMTVPGLDDNHVYYVTAIDTQDKTITLTNPYWWAGAKTLTLSLTDLVDNANSAAVVRP